MGTSVSATEMVSLVSRETETTNAGTTERLETYVAAQTVRVENHLGRLRSSRLRELSERVPWTGVIASGVLLTVMLEGTSHGLDFGLPSLMYAIGSLPLSKTWEHIDPEVIRTVLDRVSHQEFSGAVGALLGEYPKYGTEIRALLVEAGLLVGVTERIHSWLKRAEQKIKLIESGESRVRPKGEQIVVLAGRGSRTAEALVGDLAERAVLVVDDPSNAKWMTDRFRDRVKRGDYLFLNLGVGASDKARDMGYSETKRWGLLELSEKNLIRARNGQSYLLLVGQGESRDDPLSGRAINLMPEDLQTAAGQIHEQLVARGVKIPPENVVQVYVADSRIKVADIETGEPRPNREVAKETGVNIYVDLGRVVMKGVESYLERWNLTTTPVRVVGSDAKLIAELEEKVRENLPGKKLVDAKSDRGGAVLLVHSGTAERTFQDASRLRKRYVGRPIIALLSGPRGDLPRQEQDFGVVSIPELLSGEIEMTRDLLRQGVPVAEIQQRVD